MGARVGITRSLLFYHYFPLWRSFFQGVGAEVVLSPPTQREISTPLTLERYTANFEGAAYGWEQSPNQVGPRRLSPRTPIENLYLAGHWTFPGGGIASVTVSGRIAAQEVLRARG